MSGNVYKGSIPKGLCGCSGFWWGPPSRSKEIQHLQFKELPVQPQDNMGSVLAKYLVGNLAWVPPFGGNFGTGGSGIGRGAAKERLRHHLVLAIMKLKSFGKMA